MSSDARQTRLSDADNRDSVYLKSRNGRPALYFELTPAPAGMSVSVFSKDWNTPNPILGPPTIEKYGEGGDLELVDREDTPFSDDQESNNWEWHNVE